MRISLKAGGQWRVGADQEKNAISAVAHLIKNEVNVKEIELLEDASDILVKQIKPNFKVLGPKFGKDMKAVALVEMFVTTLTTNRCLHTHVIVSFVSATRHPHLLFIH